METQEIHQGRLIDHIQLVVRGLPASPAFYTAIFEVLRVPLGGAGEGCFRADELFVSTADSEAAQGMLTGRHHLAVGGIDNGAPGERAYHPGYYAAFVLDPDGNNIDAVYHGAARRSARSVRITC